MNSEWFRTFFTGAAVEFWLNIAPQPTDDIAFLQSIFGDAPRELLDVACGAGRHAIPLANAGYRVTGVDLSHDFLERARAASRDVTWVACDMRELPWSDRFDGALCFGNSFGYADRASTRAFVAALARALKRDAAFVLETGALAESLLPSLTTQRWMQVGDVLFLSNATYDACESRLDVEYTFVRGAERETKLAHTFVYSAAALREFFAEHSLHVEAIYAGPRREPYRLGSPRALVVARKT